MSSCLSTQQLSLDSKFQKGLCIILSQMFVQEREENKIAISHSDSGTITHWKKNYSEHITASMQLVADIDNL